MSAKKVLMRLVLTTSAWLGFMALILFVAAGDWGWPQGWAFVAIFAFGSLYFGVWLLRRDPELLASRLGPLRQPGQPLWDKIFLATFILLWLSWLALMG